MKGATRDARHLARLANEMRGDPIDAAELLAVAAAVSILGHVKHSEVAVIMSDALAPLLAGAGLFVARRP